MPDNAKRQRIQKLPRPRPINASWQGEGDFEEKEKRRTKKPGSIHRTKTMTYLRVCKAWRWVILETKHKNPGQKRQRTAARFQKKQGHHETRSPNMATIHAGNRVRVFFEENSKTTRRNTSRKQHCSCFLRSRTETWNGTNPHIFWEVPRPRNIFQENEKTGKAPTRKTKSAARFWAKLEQG